MYFQVKDIQLQLQRHYLVNNVYEPKAKKSAHTQFGPEIAQARHSLWPGNISARNTSARKYFCPKQLRPREYFGPLIYFGPETTSAQKILQPAYILWPGNTSAPQTLPEMMRERLAHRIMLWSQKFLTLSINQRVVRSFFFNFFIPKLISPQGTS